VPHVNGTVLWGCSAEWEREEGHRKKKKKKKKNEKNF
jgi:hypothetical protein